MQEQQKCSYLRYFKPRQTTTKSTQNSVLKLNQSLENSVFFQDEHEEHAHYQQENITKQNIKGQIQPDSQVQINYSPKSKLRKIFIKRDSTQTKWLQYENQKILPHVSEIFNYKITNELLSNKIKNPKRDKLITFSFHSSSKPHSIQKKNISKSQHGKNKLNKSSKNNRASTTKKYIGRNTFFGDMNSPCKNYNDAYTLSLQNERMGKRIFNARSMVDQYLHSTYFTYHLYNGKISNKSKFEAKSSKLNSVAMKKLNNGLKVFFNNLSQKQKQQKQKQRKEINQNSQVSQFDLSKYQKNIDKQSQTQTVSYYGLKNKMTTINFNKSPNEPDEDCNQMKQSTKSTIFRTKTCKSNKRCKNNRNDADQIKSEQKQNEYCPFNNRSNTSYQLRKAFGINTAPDKQLSNLLSHHYESHNPYQFDLFGKGPTILAIRNFQIISNPKIKQEELIILELIQGSFHSKIKNIKGLSTNPIAYKDIHRQIKFAINTNIGDFVPLRIWKYNGITAIQIGVFDINLKAFRKKKCLEPNISILSQKKQNMARDVIISSCEGKLRKKKRMQIDVVVKFDCLLYNKKFSKCASKHQDAKKDEII